MFNFIKRLFGQEKVLGALKDTRPYNEQAKDYKFNEIVAQAAPVGWEEKAPTQWREFSLRDQDGSSSCVAQSIAKMAEIVYFLNKGSKVPFSAAFYKLRSNFPEEGMIGINALDIWRTKGVPLEALAPSQKKTEAQMNNIKLDDIDLETAKDFAISNYVVFDAKVSFDQVASTVQKTGKGVMVWFAFDSREWTDIPTILVTKPRLAHSVVAVDTTLYGGKEYLVIEDSWGKFGRWVGKRLISREFYEKRNFFAAYPINFKLLAGGDKPRYTFTKSMSFSTLYNADVVQLQNILKYEGFFPVNVESSGIYGSITANAVLGFQKKYEVADEQTLDLLNGRQVGPSTLAKLNQLFG